MAANGKKRSRWDDEDDAAPPLKAALAPKPIKTEKGLSPDVRQQVAPPVSAASSEPFKWGESIKMESEESSESKAQAQAEEGTASTQTHTKQGGEDEGEQQPPQPKEKEEKFKADFGLSGALAKDEKTGNLRNGVVLKYSQAQDAAAPPSRVWRLYVFNGDVLEETLYIHREPCYLIGKDRRVADILLAHPSCSKQHAVIVFRNVKVAKATDAGSSSISTESAGAAAAAAAGGAEVVVNKPYLMDLKSTNKTYLNGDEVDDSRYYELRERDCITFGAGQLEYVLLHDKSAD
jgi:smad nuclear-interacting protein 1